MKSMRIRRPRALSSVLAALGMLQPRALSLLIRVDFIDLLSNYYVYYTDVHVSTGSNTCALSMYICSPVGK